MLNLSDTNYGFTLVEMIVAVGIFTLVAVAAVSALMSVIDANQRSRSLAQTNNNLNFSLQTMVREIRNGFSYGCDPDNPGDTTKDCSESSFGFTNADRDDVSYELNNKSITRTVTGGSSQTLTPPQVTVDHLRFDVVGASNNNEQSRVVITIEAESGTGENSQTFNLQTTATQRLLYTPS
jgi:prepilin-type N-terminal cleavage/methylation domain-containing protein